MQKLKEKESEYKGLAELRDLQPDNKLKELAEKASAFNIDQFLSAKVLELTEHQRTALIDTLDLMESGGIDHENIIDGKRFTMIEWVLSTHDCGTVCCIGGTASLLAGGPYIFPGLKSIFHDENGEFTGNAQLNNLFYKWGGGNVTVERAAKQLRHYLETDTCSSDWAWTTEAK
jgi:hypothetical protein